MARKTEVDLPADQKLRIVQEGLRSEQRRNRECKRREIPIELFNKWRGRVIQAGKRSLARAESAVGPDGKRFTADEKVGIVLQGMRDGTDVNDLRRRHRISTKQYEEWHSAFVEAGEKALARPFWMPAPTAANFAILVALVVVVLLGIGRMIWRHVEESQPETYVTGWPEPDLDLQVTKIDLETGEVFTRAVREWRKLGVQGKRWENPTTGAYTLVHAITCASCGHTFPAPTIPPEVAEAGPASVEDYSPFRKCPKCGQSPYGQFAP